MTCCRGSLRDCMPAMPPPSKPIRTSSPRGGHRPSSPTTGTRRTTTREPSRPPASRRRRLTAATRTPSRPGCWSGCWSCGSRWPMRRRCSASTTWRCSRRRWPPPTRPATTNAHSASPGWPSTRSTQDAEPSRAARLLERRGKLLGHVGKSDGLAELRRAYELAVRQTDDPGRASLLADVAYHISRLDRVEGTKLAEEARRVADEVGDREAEMSAALTLGRVCSRGPGRRRRPSTAAPGRRGGPRAQRPAQPGQGAGQHL